MTDNTHTRTGGDNPSVGLDGQSVSTHVVLKHWREKCRKVGQRETKNLTQILGSEQVFRCLDAGFAHKWDIGI